MKRLVSALLPVFFVLNATAQHGNEWIQYPQSYFKIPVAKDGIYRVTHDALQQAGFPLSSDPRTIQLFHRGKEVAIRVEGESDGVFHSGDFIEFYGRKNDGTLDSTLYEVAAHQPHKYYNLYTDTAAYFLTTGSGNGKRISVYTGSSAGLTAESYHRSEKLIVRSDDYSPGVDYGNVLKSTFDEGEGWMGLQILQGQEITYTFDGIVASAPAAGKPLIEILLTGRGPMFHDVQIYAGSRLLSTVTFSGFESFKHIQEIEWSDIDGTGKLPIRIRVTGSGGPDRVSAGYLRLSFPQQITMAGTAEKEFFLNSNSSGLSLLNIQDPPSGLRLFDITIPSALIQIEGQLSTTLDAVVSGTTTPRRILATSQVIAAAGIKRVTFRQINPALHNYVIITHPSLRKPASGYLDPVKAFAEYRSIPEGGGFDTLVVNIDQLYNQFNYGEASPRAVYQFMKYMASVKLPAYLFLVGKGLAVNYGYRRNVSAFPIYRDLVPTGGYPASDMAFTAGLDGVPHAPAVATGRLTATAPAEVAAYLNKVKERDAMPFEDLNRKKILHLSGGIEESEPALFRDILRGFQQVAEDVYLGGHVQAIVKHSTEIKLINIAEEVNKGLGLITFFGHSAPNTLDFDIGHVTDPIMGYNNAGKYPFLLMNGCDAGSFFLNTAIMGENWITAPGRGAVGFIAHSSYGLVTGLEHYSSTFYDVAFADSTFIKKGVGMVQQQVAKRYLAQFGSSASDISQVQQMVLLGDPAVQIFGAEKPDYSPDEEKVSVSGFNGEEVTALTDSFRIHIPIRNFGLARHENIRINVKRQYSDQVIEYDTIIPPALFADTVDVVIRNADTSGSGINTFTIHVDADNFIQELNEDNNTASIEYFIPLNGTRNLYPYDYSIVNDREISLSFQYTDMLGATRAYDLEVDTTATFDSGYKQKFTVTTKVLGIQNVTLADRDSVAYYWRTRIAEPLDNESKSWAVSSFTYIRNSPEGWAQIDFPQFANNTATGLVKDPELRRLKFQETVSDIALKTFAASAGKPLDSVSFKINGVEFNILTEGGACRNNTINLVAFDRRSTQPYAGVYFKWYEILYEYGGARLLCGREPYVINSFRPQELNTGNGDDVHEYVDNIATGDSVLLFSIGDAGYQQWPDAAKSKLAELGISAAQLSTLQNGDPVVILGRKGSTPGSAHVFHAPSPQTALTINKTIAGRFVSGTLSSGLIGPAERWGRFVPRVREAEAVDEFSFALVGVKSDGEQDTLKTGISLEEDISFVDAAEYPHIRVVFETKDNINLTAVQLAKWIVLYEPVAEGLIVYDGPAEKQTLHQGEQVSREFAFINISNKAFSDSLAVRFDLVNRSNGTSAPSQVKIKGPAPGDTTTFALLFETLSAPGLNDVEVFVNPRIVAEKTYDNNVIVLREHLEVLEDKAHPVIDVTFDGRYLRDNEQVSANPSILIRVWDENQFRLKTDTLGIRIFMSYPCTSETCEFQPIYFSRDDVSWDPATDTSDFTIRFLPRDLVGGQYTLRVEAQDASGNPSGDQPYEIRFIVDLEKSIDVTSAYPNPFILETGWDVVITGAEQTVRLYRVYITTLNGKVAAEFSGGDVGLHIGFNRIRWNGTGNDGQSLPSGIYFYRLIISGEEKPSEHTGKIVLIR